MIDAITRITSISGDDESGNWRLGSGLTYLRACFLIFLINFGGSAISAELLPSYKFENGNWYDGESFKKEVVYVANGIISRVSPGPVDHVIDLNNAYVVPAFGEAHSHRPANVERVLQDNEFFLGAGIFYVMNHGSLSKYHATLVDQLSLPGRIDATFSNAIVSSSQSHSVDLWQRLLDRGAFPDTSLEDLDGEAFIIIDTAADLQRRWPEVLASRPEFIKIMLQHSDEYEIRHSDIQYFGDSGLDPALIPDIVERAHSEGLRVSAHIESAADFRAAVTAGVDVIAHLPGYDVALDDDIARYRLSPDDAELAASRDVVVLTTTLLSMDRAELEPERLKRMVQNHIENLRLLNDADVRLGVGSDQFSKNSIDELINLASLGVFDNATLLNMISSVTPLAIFPDRQIGSLADGAEANFLILDSNPLDDIGNVKNIRMRVKDGIFLP